MEQAQLTWSPQRHHVWPASFRRAAHMVMRVGHHLQRDHTRVAISHDAWLEILSWCTYGWFHKAACGWCQQEDVPLKRCTGCHLVVFCGKECSTKAWAEHKKVCKPEQRRLKALKAMAAKKK